MTKQISLKREYTNFVDGKFQFTEDVRFTGTGDMEQIYVKIKEYKKAIEEIQQQIETCKKPKKEYIEAQIEKLNKDKETYIHAHDELVNMVEEIVKQYGLEGDMPTRII